MHSYTENNIYQNSEGNTMTPEEYNQFIIDNVVDHDGERYEVECPACDKLAIKHTFEACHTGSVNQHYTLNCKHCGHHECNEDVCDICDEDHEEALKQYNESLKADL